MEKIIDLNDLLKHEIQDLYSAEEQIIEALPSMAEKAVKPELKKALREHLKVTEQQKKRLDKVKQLLGEEEKAENNNKGFFSNLFGGGSHKCKGMEGLIEEGKKIMGLDMTTEVSDAAIIAAAQKIEHYEICGYGTARAYARQLDLGEVAELLEETLNEEYQADDRLTNLAVTGINEEAEVAEEDDGPRVRKVSPKAEAPASENGKKNGQPKRQSNAAKKGSPSSKKPQSSDSKKTRSNAARKSATSKTQRQKSGRRKVGRSK